MSTGFQGRKAWGVLALPLLIAALAPSPAAARQEPPSPTPVAPAEAAPVVVSPNSLQPSPNRPQIVNPRWLRQPMPQYPRAAERSGVDGRVAVQCTVTATGVIEDCLVMTETPPGLGFAEAALAATARARIEPRMVDGVAQGGRIRFTVPIRRPE